MVEMARVRKSIEEIKNLFNLEGKVAIVTGGAGGLGKALAIGLAAYGADIVVTGRTIATLEETAKEVTALGRKCKPIACDVTVEEQVVKMVDETVKEFGKVDILVNVAGLAIRHPAEEFDANDFDKVMDINVKGTFLCCKAVAKYFIPQRRGKIINISSVRGFNGHPGGYAAYGTSKGAINLLTKQLATEWAKYNINVNAIAPCIFWTDLTKEVLENEELYKIFMSRIPMGRAPETDEFIGAAVFLASAASDFVTGDILCVDGGTVAG